MTHDPNPHGHALAEDCCMECGAPEQFDDCRCDPDAHGAGHCQACCPAADDAEPLDDDHDAHTAAKAAADDVVTGSQVLTGMDTCCCGIAIMAAHVGRRGACLTDAARIAGIDRPLAVRIACTIDFARAVVAARAAGAA